MNILHDITGPVAAFIAGIITSLHCMGMCGPLACALCVKNQGRGRFAAIGIYHLARFVSYAVIGFVAGAIGQRVAGVFLAETAKWIVWIFVFLFFLIAAGVDKKLQWPFRETFISPALQHHFSPLAQTGILGFLTPLIPCAPLYLVILTAAFSGSALSGVFIMAGFCLGTIPLMFVSQSQYLFLSSRLSPRALDILRRSLAFVSMGLLVYRGALGPSLGIICH